MKHAAGPRREIGIRTVFNILGPITNPARAEFQVIGVPSQELGHKIAAVLHRLGTKHSLVVHSLDGMDELSISGKSVLWEVNEQGVLPLSEVEPAHFGFKKTAISEIRGGTPEENAAILRRVLSGEKGPGRDVVVLNAAAALYAGNRASDLREGVRLAEATIDNGQAREKLEGLITLSNKLG
jgi:anthranilate phosphoribosyltransferase